MSSSIELASAGDQAHVVGRTVLHQHRWLRLCEYQYVDAKGAERKWEALERTTTEAPTFTQTSISTDSAAIHDGPGKGKKPSVDGANILAICRHTATTNATTDPTTAGVSREDEILLVTQFRPALNAVAVELPAGLCDDEDLVSCALRELREETGFIGQIMTTEGAGGTEGASWSMMSPLLSLDPGIQSGRMVVVPVMVDLDHPANQRPKTELEGTEVGRGLQTHRVRISELHAFLVACATTKRWVVDAKLWTLSVGLNLARMMRPSSAL